MKYLVAGLGNVGEQYNDTRHNIGFTILDELADKSGIAFRKVRFGYRAEHSHKGRIIILLKPSTYVNLSGRAIRHWLQKESINKDKLLVIADDLALPFGTLRLRPAGSDGGHNGLRNIIEILESQNFARLRFGIGGEFLPGTQVDYVLGNWTTEERLRLSSRIEVCHEIIHSFATAGVEKTMNLFNNR